MNIRFIHDLEKKIFVNDAGNSVKTIPEIAYGMRPIWEWQFINSNGEPRDFSQVRSWKAVVDNDWNRQTPPMCRTLSGITWANDIVSVPLDALTTTFLEKTDGKTPPVKGFFDLTGFDADGVAIFYFTCVVDCRNVLDPEVAVDPLDPPENYISPAQVEAIARGVVEAALEEYTPPPGGDGPPGPAPVFEFSATGIAGTWHATWVSGDLYLRVSADEGDTWQGPIPLGTAQATFPLVAAWSDEITYATGRLVAFGTPAGLYQAKEPVGYEQSPETHPAKWQQIAGPGTAGTSSTWLLGNGAPAAELGNDNDQYLDELYNHYRKADGAWTQIGNIKGANGAGINNRGAWDPDAAYSVGDGVTSNGSVWRCKVPHSGQEPPATPEGVSLYWDLFLARGVPGGVGAAGTVQIVAINMVAPTASAYASEGAGSTPARRIYTLNIPRGSTGPAGSLRIEMGLPLETGEAPTLEEIAGSTPYNRAYLLRVPMGPQGERGTGMYVNATGTLAERVQYDSAAAGYAFLATDILTDDLDHHYQAMYVKESASVGDWSDAIRLYMGQQGLPGKDGVGIQGLPGENAAVKPDQEFVADDLFEGTLIVEGTDPIAQVEINDVSGHGHALSLASGDSGIAITTRRDTGQTLVAFGSSVDLTYGGRIRFAQGLSGLSLYQMWLDAGHTGSQGDYIEWLRSNATRIDVTDDDLVDVGSGDQGVIVETGGVVIAVIDDSGVQFMLADSEVWYAAGNCTVNLQRLLTLKSIETIPDTWQLILAAGKGEQGKPGDPAELSSSPAVALAATAAAGVSTVAARADHVHPTTGLVTPAQLANFMPITLRGVANGVASLDATGKVPASQLPEMSGGGGLPITRQRLARPYFDDATHLVVEAATWPDFSDVARVIDTAAVVSDRAKTLGSNGSVFVVCPAEGFGGVFSGQTFLVDLAGLVLVPSYLRYKWTATSGDSDWYFTFFPSNGEAYVAPPASSIEEIPPYEPPPDEPLSGGLYILDGTTEYLLAETVEQVKVSGKFCVIDGKLYYKSGVTSITQIGEETNWTDVSALDSMYAIVLNTAGEIYRTTVSTTTRIGSASNWVKLSHGFTFGAGSNRLLINSEGALYAIEDNTTITLVDIGPGWTDAYGGWQWNFVDSSFSAYASKSGALYTINNYFGTDFGVSRIGTDTDWGAVTGGTTVSSGATDYPFAYVIKGPGHLYLLHGIIATRIGNDSDWTLVTGTSYPSGITIAHAIKSGALYSLQYNTATQIGSDSDWIFVQGRSNAGGQYIAYGIRSNGYIYKINGASVSQVGIASGWSHVFSEADDDLSEDDLFLAVKEAEA